MKKNSKPRKKNNSKKFILLSSIFCFLIIIIFIYTFSDYIIKIYDIYKQKQNLNERIIVLKEEKNKLSSEVEKLKDPEYVARYAREKYFYSKDGEYIIKMPE